MATFNRILAAADLSGNAREAVLRAARIARDTGAALHVVHVLQVATLHRLRNRLGDAPADLRARLENAARFGLEKLADTAVGDHGVEPALLCEGELMEEIGHSLAHTLDQEEELGYQLVVVGKGSGSRVDDFLLGSLSRRVLAQSTADVLMSV